MVLILKKQGLAAVNFLTKMLESRRMHKTLLFIPRNPCYDRDIRRYTMRENEQKNAPNRNMPLRLLDYITRIYEKVVPSRKKFARATVKIPALEFYVLYNGRGDFPAESEIRL